MNPVRLLLASCAALVFSVGSVHAEDGSYTVETTASTHTTDRAYFAPGAPHWSEVFSRARLQLPLTTGVKLHLGGVAMTQIGHDYNDVGDSRDGRVDQLAVEFADVMGTGVAMTFGRQDFRLGNGFLIGDGYLDTHTATWNIPLSFYDGVSASWSRGVPHLKAFIMNWSPSYQANLGFRPNGKLYGGEVAFQMSEGTELAVDYLARHDRGPAQDRANAWTVRGSLVRGAVTLNGEAVVQGGTRAGATLAGRGGHANLVWAGGSGWKPTLRLHYSMLSGDDPTTTKDETFEVWQPTWNDWSEHYMGDLLASTIGAWSDMRISLAQLGVTPREGTTVRVLAHRFDRDQGATKPFAYEFDAVLDQDLGKGWSGWIMGGLVKPLDRAKADYGTDKSSTQLFASLTYKFGGAIKN